MKEFNLTEYLKNPSKKVITRDGRNVTRFLCTDAEGDYPIVALVKNNHNSNEIALSYTKDGKFYKGSLGIHDLFFAPEKKEGWTNIYRGTLDITYAGCVYDSKEEAEEHIDDTQRYIATTKVEWEE